MRKIFRKIIKPKIKSHEPIKFSIPEENQVVVLEILLKDKTFIYLKNGRIYRDKQCESDPVPEELSQYDKIFEAIKYESEKHKFRNSTGYLPKMYRTQNNVSATAE